MTRRRRLAPGLLALAIAAGCTGKPAPTVHTATTATPAVKAHPASPGGPSAAPTGAPTSPEPGHVSPGPASTAPSPAVPASLAPSLPAPTAPAGLLRKPSTPSTLLAGRVAIDASYVEAAHGGSVIGGASGLLAAGATHLGADGNLVTAGGAIIANNGGNVIANNAGNLVSNNAGSFHLLDATAATVPLGTSLPAAGMAVGVRSLRTGQPVPLGVDDAGQPVTQVFTNLQGGFEVYVPADEAGNVLVEARVPTNSDPRQQLSVITPVAAAATSTTPRTIDEDTNLVTHNVRQAFIQRMVDIFVQDPQLYMCLLDRGSSTPPVVREATKGLVNELHQAAVGAGITRDPALATATWVLAERCADLVLAEVDLDGVTIVPGNPPFWTTPAENAVQACVKVLEEGRRVCGPALAADPTVYDKMRFMQVANQCKPGTYAIHKVSDVSYVILTEFLASNQVAGYSWTREALEEVGVSHRADSPSMYARCHGATEAFIAALSLAFITNQDGAKDKVLAAMKAFDPQHPLPAGAPVPTVIPSPCPWPILDDDDAASIQACSTAAAAATGTP